MIADNFFFKTACSIGMATIIWWVAYWLNAQPRGLDWWILFSVEYTGMSYLGLRARLGIE